MPRYDSLFSRLIANTHEPETERGCWVWKAKRDRWGYGRLNVYRNGRHATVMAHVEMWRALGEEIPDGHHLDHLCCNPSCINPDHLDPVLPAENMRRRSARLRVSTYLPSL